MWERASSLTEQPRQFLSRTACWSNGFSKVGFNAENDIVFQGDRVPCHRGRQPEFLIGTRHYWYYTDANTPYTAADLHFSANGAVNIAPAQGGTPPRRPQSPPAGPSKLTANSIDVSGVIQMASGTLTLNGATGVLVDNPPPPKQGEPAPATASRTDTECRKHRDDNGQWSQYLCGFSGRKCLFEFNKRPVTVGATLLSMSRGWRMTNPPTRTTSESMRASFPSIRQGRIQPAGDSEGSGRDEDRQWRVFRARRFFLAGRVQHRRLHVPVFKAGRLYRVSGHRDAYGEPDYKYQWHRK